MKVSIITPCFNAEEYIDQTYTSLKDQTYSNWEWIVFDDCSKDKSFQRLQELASKDKRLLIFQNDKNSGAAITRNNCLNKATGDYLAFMDCDDLWSPEKLAKQVNFLESGQGNFTYSNYEIIDSNGDYIKTMNTPLEVSGKDLLKFNPFATSSVFIRRSAVENNKIRFLEHLRRRQDYLFWFDVIQSSGPATRCPGTLSKYRLVGDSSLSSNKKKMAIIQWNLYRNEFNLSLISSIYYFLHYAVHGIKKYFLK